MGSAAAAGSLLCSATASDSVLRDGRAVVKFDGIEARCEIPVLQMTSRGRRRANRGQGLATGGGG